MKFSVFQASHRGGRRINEDRMGHCYTRDSALFMLADGLGAHPDGELAACLALQTSAHVFDRLAAPAIANPKGFLDTALQSAHERIMRHAIHHHMPDTPLTTLVAALVQDEQLHWIHCGDSRLYLVRDGRLLIRTRDHSHAEYAARNGLPAPGLRQGLLYACLGMPKKLVRNVGGPIPLQPGDRLLMCSDGLWNNLTDEEIVAGLVCGPVKQAAIDLVDKATGRCGGHCDNVTVVAVDWANDSEPDADTIDTVLASQVAGASMPAFDLPNVPA